MESSQSIDNFHTIIMKASIPRLSYELHFNLWRSQANKINLLDVGLMCPLQDRSYTIDLSFPGQYRGTDDIKCINYLIQDTTIASNVFNCGMRLHDANNSKCVEKDNSIILISNYKTDQPDSPYSIPVKTSSSDPEKTKLTKEVSSRTTIHISVSPQTSCPNLSDISTSNPSQALTKKEYFRFRIYNFDLRPFSTEASSETNFLAPVYEKDTIVDFRINDTMLLSSDDQSTLGTNPVYFEKIHFLLIDDLLSKITIKDPTVTIRLFENSKWETYLDTKVPKPMMAYHYRKKSSNSDLTSASFLVKIEESKINYKAIVSYVAAALLIGLIVNAISTLTFHNLTLFFILVSTYFLLWGGNEH